MSDVEVPTITIRLVDPEKFRIEISFEPSSMTPVLVRAMLNDAVETIKSLIADQDALAFQGKMAQASAAYRAMQKPAMKI